VGACAPNLPTGMLFDSSLYLQYTETDEERLRTGACGLRVETEAVTPWCDATPRKKRDGAAPAPSSLHLLRPKQNGIRRRETAVAVPVKFVYLFLCEVVELIRILYQFTPQQDCFGRICAVSVSV